MRRIFAILTLAVAAVILLAYTTTIGTDPTIGQPLAAVYPYPGSQAASPQTQISIRGITPDDIGTVTVTGSRSGKHDVTPKPDSDGNGESLYPATPFEPGETVTVDTGLNIPGAFDGDYTFTVATLLTESGYLEHKDIDDDIVQHFASAPDLAPPALTVTHNTLPPGDDNGDIFISPKRGHGQYGPMIMTTDNQLIWFDPMPDDLSPFDFRVQHYQGEPVLTFWRGRVTHGHGRGYDVIYDDTYHQIAEVHAGNGYMADLHDFTITARDTALVTIYQPTRWDLSAIGGPSDGTALDSIVEEIDIPTGNVLAEWHALDHITLANSYASVPAPDQHDKQFDFFHVNSPSLDDSGQLLISARAMHTIYNVDLATGRILWRLGGKASSFSGDGNNFSSQHNAKWRGPHTISLFDNAAGVGNSTADRSSGMIVRLDTHRHRATVEQRLRTTTVPRASSQGNTQPLPDGGAFIGWGGEPYLSQYDAAGNLVWEAKLPDGYQSYRAYRFPWTGHPTTDPAVAVELSGGVTSVAMSWNGATEVASWRVVGGDTADAALAATAALAAGADGDDAVLASGPWTGFETTLTIAGDSPGAVVAQALAADGTVLGTSQPVIPGAH